MTSSHTSPGNLCQLWPPWLSAYGCSWDKRDLRKQREMLTGHQAGCALHGAGSPSCDTAAGSGCLNQPQETFFLTADGLVWLDCIWVMLREGVLPAWVVHSLAHSSNSRCRCTQGGWFLIKFKGLQQLVSRACTVLACCISDCCHHYFNKLYVYPFHSPATKKKFKSDIETPILNFFLCLSWKGQVKKKKRKLSDHVPEIFWKSTGLMREE